MEMLLRRRITRISLIWFRIEDGLLDHRIVQMRSINDFIAIRAARDVFAIIGVECGAGECGASFQAVGLY